MYMDKPIGYRPPIGNGEVIRQLREQAAKAQEEAINQAAERNLLRQAPQQINYAIPAIRGWHIDMQHHLRSLVYKNDEELWSGPVTHEPNSPVYHGSTGYWAVKPMYTHILRWYRVHVVGFVELSGHVIEHERGWRGEICTIQHLYVLPDGRTGLPNMVADLENRYQCDVSMSRNLDDIKRKAIG